METNETSDDVCTTLEEMFEKECAIALQLGMPYELYWEGEPCAMIPFSIAHHNSVKTTYCNQDVFAWIAGQYNRAAFGDILNSAFAKKGTKPKSKYPSKPQFTECFDEMSEERKQQRAVEQSYRNFLNTARRYGFKVQEDAT